MYSVALILRAKLLNHLYRPLSRMSNLASTIAAVVATSIVLFPIVSAQKWDTVNCEGPQTGLQNKDGTWKQKNCFCRSLVTCKTCNQANPCSLGNKQQGDPPTRCSNCFWTVCNTSGSQGFCRSEGDYDSLPVCIGRRVIWPYYADMCFFEEPGHVAGVVIGVFAIINALSFACMNAKYFDEPTRRKWCLIGLLLPVVSIIMYCYINRDKLAAIREERQAKREKAIEKNRLADLRNPPVHTEMYDVSARNAEEHRQRDLQHTLDWLGGGPASRGYAPR